MPNQVVVSGGFVKAIHDDKDELYNLYDHATFAWFDYDMFIDLTDELTVLEIIFTTDENDVMIAKEVEKNITVEKLDVPDPRITMTLANAKLAVISQLKRITNYEILATYPLQKQLNINRQLTGYVVQDRTDMDTFINGKYSTLTSKTAAVNALTTVPDIISYNVWQ